MPLEPLDGEFLKTVYRQMDDRPLESGDPLYQPIYDPASGNDPIELIRRHIELSDAESVQLFSGFRGSGKTTELFRLQMQLRDAGQVVLYSDALDYINPAEPIDITDLLIVLAGAFSEKVLASNRARTVIGDAKLTWFNAAVVDGYLS